MFGLDRHVSTQCVHYKTCSCACSHTIRRVSVHFLSYEVISMRNVKHMTPCMLVTKFSIDKSKRCTTAWLKLRTLLSMQFFTYKAMSENSGLTHAKDCDVWSLWKDVPLHNSTDMFPRSVSTTRCVHARVHTLKDGCLYSFWLTKSCLCVTLNISHLVCHMISHRCSRNKVQHHNFLNLRTLLTMQLLSYKDVSVCKLSHMRTCLFATCHKISNVLSRPPCFHALCSIGDVFMCVFAH